MLSGKISKSEGKRSLGEGPLGSGDHTSSSLGADCVWTYHALLHIIFWRGHPAVSLGTWQVVHILECTKTGHATDFIETFLFISAWNLGQCEGNFSVLSLTPVPESGENSTRGHCGIYFCAKENLRRVKKTSCVSMSSEMGLIIQKHGK